MWSGIFREDEPDPGRHRREIEHEMVRVPCARRDLVRYISERAEDRSEAGGRGLPIQCEHLHFHSFLW